MSNIKNKSFTLHLIRQRIQLMETYRSATVCPLDARYILLLYGKVHHSRGWLNWPRIHIKDRPTLLKYVYHLYIYTYLNILFCKYIFNEASCRAWSVAVCMFVFMINWIVIHDSWTREMFLWLPLSVASPLTMDKLVSMVSIDIYLSNVNNRPKQQASTNRLHW